MRYHWSLSLSCHAGTRVYYRVLRHYVRPNATTATLIVPLVAARRASPAHRSPHHLRTTPKLVHGVD